ncbi:MAG TPA: protein kinase [Vicinamibacteria bacterium]|nr:protein kinase [Vicinamibacteria bacterium]
MSDSVPKTPAPNEGASRIPAKIGRYDVVEKLGSGSTGTVYRATDPFIGRVLAIKTFRVDLPPGALRDRFLQRFYHEARISGGLSHPNIVALFDVGETDGLPYLVFEHVDGPTLDVALARAGRLDSAETIRVVEQTAAALDFAHSKGIVHRDIRPANIILANDKRVRIADFGIARVEGSHLTQHGEVLGTPAYMSPEQIRGQELSASSDLFSLAVCAYEMLSGHRPFVGKTQPELLEALVYSPPAEPKELRTLGIPSRDFMFVFERALAKDPSHRFADAASFARALKSVLGVVAPGDDPLPVSRIAVPEAPPPFRRAILPPVAPPPPAPYRVDTAATVSLAANAAGSRSSSSADATMVSNYAGEPGSGDISEDPTLSPTVGFDQGLNAKKLDLSADATMVTPGQDAELPATQQRLSRQAVESLLSKSAPSQGAAGASPTPPLQKTLPGSEKPPASPNASAIEDLLPPTREMPRLTLPQAAPPAQDPSRTASQPGLPKGAADKTIIMTEGEKAAAAQLRDRSASRIPTGAAAVPKPSPPPPQQFRPTPSRPPTLATMAPPAMAPRSSLVPKILLGAMVLLTIFALALAVLFWGKAGKPAPEAAEMWNNLPVYQEADVEKSPLLFSHEVPKPKLEPGRVVSVTVSWIVTPEGLVDDPKIEVSASPEIDAFVLEGIRKWRYEPGQKDGKTVPVRVLRKYTFGQRSSSEGS